VTRAGITRSLAGRGTVPVAIVVHPARLSWRARVWSRGELPALERHCSRPICGWPQRPRGGPLLSFFEARGQLPLTWGATTRNWNGRRRSVALTRIRRQWVVCGTEWGKLTAVRDRRDVLRCLSGREPWTFRCGLSSRSCGGKPFVVEVVDVSSSCCARIARSLDFFLPPR